MSEQAPKVITTRQARGQINRFGWAMILYLVVFLFLRFGQPYLTTYCPAVFLGQDPQLWMLVVSTIALLIVTFVFFQFSAKSLSLDLSDYLHSSKQTKGKIFSLICVGIGINLIIVSVSSLFYFFFHTTSYSADYVGNFATWGSAYLNIAYFVFFILVKPLCDEWIFRGIIQRQLGHYGRYFGVIGSAFLYAICQTNLVEAIPAFFIGWYLALVTLRYHSIRPAMGIHIFMSLFLWSVDVIPAPYLWVVTLMIIAVYVVTAFSIFSKHVRMNFSHNGARNIKLWRLLFTSFTILICLAIFIFSAVCSML